MQPTVPTDRLIFGCNGISTLPTKGSVFKLLEAVVGCKVLHFDTARSYGSGLSEKLIGEFLKAHGLKVAITTKIDRRPSRHEWIPTAIALPLNFLAKNLKQRAVAKSDVPRVLHASHSLRAIDRNEIERSLELSIKTLGVDSVEVLLLHEAVPQQLTPAAREYVQKVLESGQIKRFGLGTRREMLQELLCDDPLIEIVQYSPSSISGDPLMERFPSMSHFHHGVLRRAQSNAYHQCILHAMMANPTGRLIFSTRKIGRLRQNLGLTVD